MSVLTPANPQPPTTNPARRFAHRHGWSYLFILPTVGFFALFTVYPVIQAFTLSLQNATIVGGTFVGLENFINLAGDETFRTRYVTEKSKGAVTPYC